MKEVILEISGLGNTDRRHQRHTRTIDRYERQMRTYEKRARKARAEAYAQVFAWLGRGIASAFRSLGPLAERISRWRREQIAIRELNALDDRLLKDIGLERSDIRVMASGLAARGATKQTSTPAQAAPEPLESDGGASNGGLDPEEAGRRWRRAA